VTSAVGRATLEQAGEVAAYDGVDCMAVSMSTYPSVFGEMTGWPTVEGTGRRVEVPSVLPTADGYVNVTTNSATQFRDFCLQIGRPSGATTLSGRGPPTGLARREEFLAAVFAYTTARSSDEVLEDAAERLAASGRWCRCLSSRWPRPVSTRRRNRSITWWSRRERTPAPGNWPTATCLTTSGATSPRSTWTVSGWRRAVMIWRCAGLRSAR
jgi:crotonobetainyl-CoA:carnitine CoA-transferase CaiB-like acyl-CoA transferase